LLVSVRSAIEAAEAVAGGAAIIDVKEPSRGALGRADWTVWGAVRHLVPDSIPVSVALGELNEWLEREPGQLAIPLDAWPGLAWAKLGLANARPDWRERWRDLRNELIPTACAGSGQPIARPSWVAVVYLDWETARAPEPDSVIEVAGALAECSGVLFDTWDKSHRVVIDRSWKRRFTRVRDLGRLLALAGSLDVATIRELADCGPDIFAVRGAACRDGNRHATIDRSRVARLVLAANAAQSGTHRHQIETALQRIPGFANDLE
jgi:uncharacterized protein (UPF0264 family)